MAPLPSSGQHQATEVPCEASGKDMEAPWLTCSRPDPREAPTVAGVHPGPAGGLTGTIQSPWSLFEHHGPFLLEFNLLNNTKQNLFILFSLK